MNYKEMENREENKLSKSCAQIKQSMVIKMLSDKVKKVVDNLQGSNFSQSRSISQIHLKAYENFCKQVQEHSITFFMHSHDQQGIKTINLIDNLVNNLKKVVNYVQREMGKKQNRNKQKKQIQLSVLSKTPSICEKCQNLMVHKKVEVEKNKILYGHFDDPYNFYHANKSDLYKLLEEKDNIFENNEDIQGNKKIISNQIQKIKDRINHRSDQLIALISEFKKYQNQEFKKTSTSSQKQQKIKKYQSCMKQMIQLLKQKFFTLFSKLNTQQYTQKTSRGIQTDDVLRDLLKYYENQAQNFTKDLQLKENQKTELKRIIQELQGQIIANSEEKEKIKKRYMSISDENSIKTVQLEKQQANHKATAKRLSDVTRLFQQIKIQLKQKKFELEKYEEEQKNPKKKNRKRTKILSKKKKSRNSSESSKQQQKQQVFCELENNFDSTDEFIIKSNGKSVKKFKFNRKPSLYQQNQDSVLELGDRVMQADPKISDRTMISGVNLHQANPGHNSSTKIHQENQMPNYYQEEQLRQQNQHLSKTYQNKKSGCDNNLSKKSKLSISHLKNGRQSGFPKMIDKNKAESKYKKLSHSIDRVFLDPPVKKGLRNERVSAPIQKQNVLDQVILRKQSLIYPKIKYNSINNHTTNIFGHANESLQHKKSIFLQTQYNTEQSSYGNLRKITKNEKKSRNNGYLNYTLDFLGMGRVMKNQNLNLTNFFDSQQIPASYNGQKYEVTQIFNQQDVENLYLSVEGAIEHQKKQLRNKKNRQISPIFPHHIKFLTQLLAIIAAINSKNRYIYQAVKAILISPYQSIIAQQNYIFISKSLSSSGKIREAINQIVIMHENCDRKQKTCVHLKKFLKKLENLLQDEQEKEGNLDN